MDKLTTKIQLSNQTQFDAKIPHVPYVVVRHAVFLRPYLGGCYGKEADRIPRPQHANGKITNI